MSGARLTFVVARQRACRRGWSNVCDNFIRCCAQLGSPIDGEVPFISRSLETRSLPGMRAVLAASSSGDTAGMALLSLSIWGAGRQRCCSAGEACRLGAWRPANSISGLLIGRKKLRNVGSAAPVGATSEER
jgi:hypothetical protein